MRKEVVVVLLAIAIASTVTAIMYHLQEKPILYEENISPIADFTYTPGFIMFRDELIHFVDNSSDKDGEIVEWRWDFDNDGIIDSNGQNPSYRYARAGTYIVNLTVVDDRGAESYCEKEIEVYNLGGFGHSSWFSGKME